METDVRIEQFPGQRLAVVKRRARIEELGRIVPEACGVVWNVIRAQKIQGAGRHVAVYLDDVMNIEVGVEVSAPFTAHGEVIPSELSAGTVATAAHLGPYQTLGQTHEKIHRWCEKNGHELLRPCWEVYGHWKDEWNADPSAIRTDVFYLIKPT